MARHRQAGRSWVRRMLQPMVVVDHHAELGLAVMVLYRRAERLFEPMDHLRIERLAGRRDDAQLALDRLRWLVPRRHKKTKSRRRAGEVGNAGVGDNPVGALDSERPVIKGRGA